MNPLLFLLFFSFKANQVFGSPHSVRGGVGQQLYSQIPHSMNEVVTFVGPQHNQRQMQDGALFTASQVHGGDGGSSFDDLDSLNEIPFLGGARVTKVRVEEFIPFGVVKCISFEYSNGVTITHGESCEFHEQDTAELSLNENEVVSKISVWSEEVIQTSCNANSFTDEDNNEIFHIVTMIRIETSQGQSIERGLAPGRVDSIVWCRQGTERVDFIPNENQSGGIVGLHGRSGYLIDSLGVYYSPLGYFGPLVDTNKFGSVSDGTIFNDGDELETRVSYNPPRVATFSAYGYGGTLSCIGFTYSDGTQLFHGDTNDCFQNPAFQISHEQDEVVTSLKISTHEIDRSCGSTSTPSWQTFVYQVQITTSKGRIATAGANTLSGSSCQTQNRQLYTIEPSEGQYAIVGFLGAQRSTGSITALGAVVFDGPGPY